VASALVTIVVRRPADTPVLPSTQVLGNRPLCFVHLGWVVPNAKHILIRLIGLLSSYICIESGLVILHAKSKNSDLPIWNIRLSVGPHLGPK
jgi:hypothetical protein